MKKCAVIYNKKSGSGKFLIYKDKIEKFLNDENYDVEFYNIFDINDELYKKILVLDKNDLVMTAGGDGTFNMMINEHIKNNSDTIVTHLPFGTTNDISKNFNLKLNNIKEILKGDILNLDILKLNNKYFVYVAAIGTISSSSYQTKQSDKLKYKTFAYLHKVIDKIKKEGIEKYHIKYKTNGVEKEFRCNHIVISNAKGIAGVRDIFKNEYNDGLFEVTFIKADNIKDSINSIVNIPKIKTNNIKTTNIIHFQTNNLELSFEEPPKNNFSIDGESYFVNHKNIKFGINKKVKMLIPKR